MNYINALVEIKITVGEYEKSSHLLITNIPENRQDYAFEFACTMEAHNELECIGDHMSDGGYEFSYSCGSVKIVNDNDLAVLENYFIPFKFDMVAVKKIEGIILTD